MHIDASRPLGRSSGDLIANCCRMLKSCVALCLLTAAALASEPEPVARVPPAPKASLIPSDIFRERPEVVAPPEVRLKWARVKLLSGVAMAAVGSAATASGFYYATQLPSFCKFANCSMQTVGGPVIAAAGAAVLGFAVGMMIVAFQRMMTAEDDLLRESARW